MTMLPDVRENDPWLVRLMEKIGQVQLLVEHVDAKIMPRAEIEAADAKRVLHETYQSDMRGINERLARLEGSSSRLLAWLSVGISAVGCLGTIIAAAASATGIIIAITHH